MKLNKIKTEIEAFTHFTQHRKSLSKPKHQ